MKSFSLTFAVAVAAIAISAAVGQPAYGLLIVASFVVVRLLMVLFSVEAKRLEYAATGLIAYVGVLVLFAMAFRLLPSGSVKPDFASGFKGIVDAIYFSAVTITTLGYGDFQPVSTLARALVVTELLFGLTVIALAVNYAIGGIAGGRRVGSGTDKRTDKGDRGESGSGGD